MFHCWFSSGSVSRMRFHSCGDALPFDRVIRRKGRYLRWLFDIRQLTIWKLLAKSFIWNSERIQRILRVNRRFLISILWWCFIYEHSFSHKIQRKFVVDILTINFQPQHLNIFRLCQKVKQYFPTKWKLFPLFISHFVRMFRISSNDCHLFAPWAEFMPYSDFV